MPEQEKLYDTEILLQTHHADEEFIKYMVSLFIKHVPETNANLEKACSEKRFTQRNKNQSITTCSIVRRPDSR